MSFARLTAAVVLALGVSQAMGAALTKRVTCATGQTTANAACCALFPIVETLQNNLFDGGQCGEEAHSALRLTFNDAIGFSVNGGKGGGADGSILQFNTTEEALSGNVGIDDITARQFPVFLETGLSAGDFVHLAGAVGTSNCLGAPRLQFLFGRPPAVAPAPEGTVPLSTDDAATILARFADAGFTPQEVVALLSAHTIGASDFIDPTIPGTPFDSTIGTFDTQFFLEVLLTGTIFPGDGPNPGEVLSPIAGEMRLQSDKAIAQDASTACFWESLVNNQQSMNSQFQAAMAKLQTLGQDISQLVDCSDVIPVPQAFTSNIEFPPTLTASDLQLNCASFTFPNLATAPGPAVPVAPVQGS